MLASKVQTTPHPGQKAGLLGYIFQAAVVVQLQKYRRKLKEEEEFKKSIIQEHAREKVEIRLLDEVTRDLHDTVNNPLSIISVSTGLLREKFSDDKEVAGYLNRIEGAMNRIREITGDFKAYQTKKIVESEPSHLPETSAGSTSMDTQHKNLAAKANP
jgi:signal transduction histidine kinase